MKTNLQEIDRENFSVDDHELNGETVHLVQPVFMGVNWSQSNKHFRSSLWNNDGELISAAFPKFTNWGEKPDHFPVPTSLKNTTIVEKIDGSLLVVSKYKGQHILRTRGTVDAHKLDNGYELEVFKSEILPLVEKFHLLSGENWNYSVLFEWVSPVNKIVINYGDTPQFYLIGIIYHEDYSLIEQLTLDNIAWEHGLKRPVSYEFPTVADLMKDVDLWKGKEGVVVYSQNGQSLHKCKSVWYLSLHRMKEALSSLEKVVDVWFDQNRPSYTEFENFVTSQFDWELWTQIRGDASRICDAWKEVQNIVSGFERFVNEKLKCLSTRRDQAQLVISSYGETNRAAFVFAILDGKKLNDDQLKKLMWQMLKK